MITYISAGFGLVAAFVVNLLTIHGERTSRTRVTLVPGLLLIGLMVVWAWNVKAFPQTFAPFIATMGLLTVLRKRRPRQHDDDQSGDR